MKKTIQFTSAKTHKIICVSTAEDKGYPEADGIRKAITKAINSVFE